MWVWFEMFYHSSCACSLWLSYMIIWYSCWVCFVLFAIERRSICWKLREQGKREKATSMKCTPAFVPNIPVLFFYFPRPQQPEDQVDETQWAESDIRAKAKAYPEQAKINMQSDIYCELRCKGRLGEISSIKRRNWKSICCGKSKVR